ncbi:hypothetical protein [Capnocytophaga felis]|uniref:Lipoprotein n=1 Tax=Capnocytophaga felis TaxID=2267611 RepID=A0A5M4BBN6_9FLAO|nr:hypothetical protein [Capnocytophaga felis]GET46486.1 hypothetical protein RCZ01_17880 [Capnocytophaga felis]GET48376.1 hypothetical protein RCZ02_12070 [Capnocytophaga felis]
MKRILLLFVALTLAVGCSKNDENSQKEKVTLEIQLRPSKNGLTVSPVYLFYRTAETEKVMNSGKYEFDFKREGFVELSTGKLVKYHDKQEVNANGLVIFHNVPKDYVYFGVRYSSTSGEVSFGELLNLNEKTKYDFSK